MWVDVTYSLATYGGPAQYLSDRIDPADPKSVLQSLVVDGEDHTGDWSITDFTVAELKQWIGGTTYDARTERPTALNGQYPILTMQDVPKVETVLINRPNERSLGAGEAAQGPTAAAIANAFAAATGTRIRELPLTPERVKAALAGQT